ncbi:MAG: corrinoid protein [Coriobacteriia bacterium]|nr:corrinoid protein [Coriobacteriia bacterium]
MPTEALLKQLSDRVQSGQVKDVVELIEEGLNQGISAQSMLDDGLLHGLGELSIRFRNSEIFIAELLQASKALKIGISLIRDKLSVGSVRLHGKAVIATVEGDLHDIGKNLVKLLLEGSGMEVIDLGSDVTAAQAVDAVRKYQPDVVALSALLTTTMENQLKIVEALKNANLRDTVFIIVGGAPITAEFSRSIGADGYAADASSAVELVERLMLEQSLRSNQAETCVRP